MSATATAAATAKQAAFLARLVSERSVPAWVADSSTAASAGLLTAKDASSAIETALASPWKASTPSVQAELGYYLVDGTVYAVVLSKESGKSYAKRLSVSAGKGRWEFAPGMVWKLKPEQRISQEQAREFGKLHGVCCVCGRTLTDIQSVEAGIGPVCAKKI